MKTLAFVSDQLATPGSYGGAEKVLETVAMHYPQAPIYTPVYMESRVPEFLRQMEIKTSFIQKLPLGRSHVYLYLPLLPWAMESFDLQDYDVVVSFHHSVAKGVLVRPDAAHICYCHTPGRYFWDQYWTYTSRSPAWQTIPFQVINPFIRSWDVLTANRVDCFIANSSLAAKRIQSIYRREAQILFPPVDTEKFHSAPAEDFHLMVGRLVEYKCIDIAIDAFNVMKKRLVIVGAGPDYRRLKKRAGPTIEFKGRLSDVEVIGLMSRCSGLVHTGVEDFGIAMAEAQAAGKPVIALNRGGATDIILHGETGLLIEDKTPEAFGKAVYASQKMAWSVEAIQENSTRFSAINFISGFKAILSPYMAERDVGLSAETFFQAASVGS